MNDSGEDRWIEREREGQRHNDRDLTLVTMIDSNF